MGNPLLWVSVPAFPVPVTNETGAFLVKDVFLPGAALWCAGESLNAVRLASNGEPGRRLTASEAKSAVRGPARRGW